MTISSNAALLQTEWTVAAYSSDAIRNLCKQLDIDRGKPGWQKKLEPFAPVLAAMITAAAADFNTACTNGVVESTLAQARLNAIEIGEGYQ